MQTIRELAQALGVSKTAVNAKIKQLGIKDELQSEGGRYTLTDEQAEQIKSLFTANRKPQTENREQLPESLRKQIEELQKRIEQKDAQIADLHEIIKTQATLIDQEQKLHLIAEQKLLALEDQAGRKKGIFARLFRNKAEQPPQDSE